MPSCAVSEEFSSCLLFGKRALFSSSQGLHIFPQRLAQWCFQLDDVLAFHIDPFVQPAKHGVVPMKLVLAFGDDVGFVGKVEEAGAC
jgi:hypothetical protein